MFSKINTFSFKSFGLIMILSSIIAFYVQLHGYSETTRILNLLTIKANSLLDFNNQETYGIFLSSLINVFQLGIGFYFLFNKKTNALFYFLSYLMLISFVIFGVFVMNDVCYIMDDNGVFNCSLGVVRPLLLLMTFPLLMYICMYRQLKKAT